MRVYYSGDMANQPGWFTRRPSPGGTVSLVEEGGEGRRLTVSPQEIGDVYHGHCSPRFVTEAAYNAFQARSLEAIAKAGERNVG